MNNQFDTTAFLTMYEDSEPDYEQTVEKFQHLINNGLAWRLPSHYGRTATTDFNDTYIGDDDA